MKTVAKTIAAIVVVVALAACLSVGVLWLLYFLLIISLFYKGAMFFLIGAVIASLVAWIGIKVFDRKAIYSIRKGVHYESKN